MGILTLPELLKELILVEGINTAVLVSRDGFVIEAVSRGGKVDTEAVGAVISTGVGSSEVVGNELGIGQLQQGMFEYKDGIIVISLLGADSILAVVATTGANLGNIRYQLKKRSVEIEKAM
ncbi:MAG: roadblock/LC7 domain-containing protein [Acidobacteria bacterium]|nr:roadblock/LC7 domain-containing protein [Acidobacteriota bacterium]